MHTRFAAHSFSSLTDPSFSPVEYSHLKFGSDGIARKFGRELAAAFFKQHSTALLTSKCVVIPSPYNYVRNAATVLTGHFVNALNHLLVAANGQHVEYSTIHRKVSYINDYGFLSKEKRRSLINQDSFFIHNNFYKDKTLIFVDDVIITGVHEEKVKDILVREGLQNKTFFLYYAQYVGNSPEIEAEINFAGIKNAADYVRFLIKNENHHIIVRPIKFMLALSARKLRQVLCLLTSKDIYDLYHGCLGEGYYKLPQYQTNFKIIARKVKLLEQQ